MKMSKGDFTVLKKYCIKSLGEHNFKYWEKQYLYNGLSEKRLRWDMFWGASTLFRQENGDHLGDLYIKGLNDSHIDTALKTIAKELANEG